MYLLYLDDAGDVKKREDKHFILSGIAVFERQAHWLQAELDHFTETLGYRDFDGLHRPDKLGRVDIQEFRLEIRHFRCK